MNEKEIEVEQERCTRNELNNKLQDEESNAENPTEYKNKNGNTQQDYKCFMCDKTYTQYQQLKKHESTHLGEKQFKCEICQKSFKYEGNFKNHKQIHENFHSFNCTLCNKTFRLNILLNKHLRTHTTKKIVNNLPPNQFLPSFTNSQNSENHTSLIGTENEENFENLEEKPPTLVCETQLREESIDEEIVVKIEPRDICDGEDLSEDCEASFAASADAAHPDSDSTCTDPKSRYKKRYKCTACDKEFKWPSDLEIHSRIHNSDRPFECTTCQKTFKRQDALKRHKFTHTGIKPFECDVCSKTFNQMSTLIKHKRIHDNIRPYKCQVCGKTYTSGTNLVSHQRIHH